MKQIGCWMDVGEAARLDVVAKAVGLRRPSACVLLVHRELRERRLPDLARYGPYAGAKIGIRVTARVKDPEVKEAFAAHVHERGFGSDEGAFFLFRAELDEDWLRETLGWRRNHP